MPSHTACLNRTESHFPLSMWLTTADQTYVGSKVRISRQRLRDQDGCPEISSVFRRERDRKRKLESTFWRWDKLIDVLRAYFCIFWNVQIIELLPQLACHWLVTAACPAHLDSSHSPPLVCAILIGAPYPLSPEVSTHEECSVFTRKEANSW